MEEIKAILESLVSNCLRASNASDDEEKKDDKKEACNEDVDKRKKIDEVAGMMKSAGCSDELIRTAIKDMEEAAYDKSEAGTAANCGKNAKNEAAEEKEDEKKAENKKAKNEEVDEEKEVIEEKKEAENKKACNSIAIDKAVNDIISATNAQSAPKYETQADRLELGNKY